MEVEINRDNFRDHRHLFSLEIVYNLLIDKVI